MEKNAIFNKERKGYCCKEVDEFLTELNARHEIELSEKDAEIKRLFSEKEDLAARLDEATANAEALEARLTAAKKQNEDEAARMNARIGEKLSAAEDAARDMLKKAEEECEELKRQCRIQISADVDDARKKASEYCEKAKRATDIYVEKQQLIASGLEQARRHLDDAVRAVDAVLAEKQC